MSKSADALRELLEALEKWSPNCEGSDLYTADDFSRADLSVMRTVCESCPLYPECFQYAATARPVAGFWAGHSFSYYKNTKGLAE